MTVVPKHTRHEMSGINGADTGAARAMPSALRPVAFATSSPLLVLTEPEASTMAWSRSAS